MPAKAGDTGEESLKPLGPQEEKNNGPKTRFETQTLLFYFSDEKENDKHILEQIASKLNAKGAKDDAKAEDADAEAKKVPVKVYRAYNLMSRNSDTHMLGINLVPPQIRQLSSEFMGKRITEHEGHRTPSGLEFDSVEYHADGGEKHDKRLGEHLLLAENDKEWVAVQQMRAARGGDGSRDRIIAFDCNISVATFNVKQQQADLKRGIIKKREEYLTWNKDYIQFLETAFPSGIYRIAMPSLVMSKPRGVADEQGHYVANFGNNQSDKEGVPVYAAKPGIIHVKTDSKGNPIKGYDPKNLLKEPIQFKIVDFKDSKTLEDHPPVEYIFNNEVAVTCTGNLAVTGFKAWNDPRKSFMPRALNDKGGVKLDTVRKNQFCMTELGKCLNDWLQLGIKEEDLGLLPPETKEDRPAIKATSDFSKLFRDRFKEKVKKELATQALRAEKNEPPLAPQETVAWQLKHAMTEWLFSTEYYDSADDLLYKKEPAMARDYSKHPASFSKMVDVAAIEKFIAESNKKGEFEDFNFKEFLRLFNVEWSGGFWLEDSDVVDNNGVDKRQSEAAVARLGASLRGETGTLVLGGDGQDQDRGNIQAALEIRTESYLAPTVACRNLARKENSQQFEDILNDKSSEQEFLLRCENEIYYANKVGDGVLIHIAKEKCDKELYSKLTKAFVNAEKEGGDKTFNLDASKDSKIFAMLSETFGIFLNSSKDEVYHQGVEDNLGIPKEAVKRVQMLGFFRERQPLAEVEKRDNDAAMTLVAATT